MRKLFWKFFFALWAGMMGFLLLMVWAQSALVETRLPERPEEEFARNMQRVERALAQRLRAGGTQAAREAMQSWPRQLLRHVYLFGPDGRELLGRHEAAERLRSLQQDKARHGREAMLHRSRLLLDASGAEYRLVMLSRSPPGRLLERGPRGMLLRLLLAALVSAVVSFFLARSLSRPLERLGAATRKLAAGDLDARAGASLVARRDEMGLLARDFDHMAGRLQALGEANRRLLRDVSHELRSPLARLRVAVELARQRGAGVVAGELDRIELESDRLDALVGEVLDLLRESSDAAPLRPERFDLAEFLDDLGEAAAYEADASGTPVSVQCPRPLWVLGDRELLWRAVENVLRNAVSHAGDGGRVELEAGASEGEVQILVRDSGPGIPAPHLDRIFDPFYRVQEARDRGSGGHGLGLAIAAAAVRRHGGRVQARNRERGGLAIALFLPIRA